MTRLIPILAILLLPLFIFAKRADNSFTTTSSTLSFVDNVGQVKDQHGNARTDIDYKIATPGMSVFIGNGQLHYQWYGAENANHEIPTYRMDVSLAGANTQATAYTDGQHAEYETYYIRSHTGKTAHMYTRVTYKNVYPNIDWVLYTQGNSLKYDFVVHPGGNPKDIQLQFEGASSLQLSAGALQAVTPMGSITEQAPYSYLQNSGEPVSSKYILNGNTLSFDVTTPASNNTLVIDPVIAWATYFGGSGSDLTNITTDAAGNIYVYGQTDATSNIATTGAFQYTYKTTTLNASNGYINKFDGNGQRIWGTYADICNIKACAIDKYGDLYLGGQCEGDWNIATPGAYQTTHLNTNFSDGFLMKIDDAGQLQWATIYGGTVNDWVNAVACDTAGNVYITGYTASVDGITGTPGSYQPANPFQWGGFVAKFDGNGQRQMASFIYDQPNGGTYNLTSVAVDLANNIYVAGEVVGGLSTMTPGTFQANFAGGYNDGIIYKFDQAGQRIWSTYYGGTGDDGINSMAVNAEKIYVYGATNSTDTIPTAGCYQPTKGGDYDAFLAELDTAGHRIWSTYYGGSGSDAGYSISMMVNGDILVAGTTASTNAMASPGAYQTTLPGTNGCGHFATFSTAGQRIYGSYLGGNTYTFISSTATDLNGAIYLGGRTYSTTGLATTGSFLTTFQGGATDGFFAKFNADNTITVAPLLNLALCQGSVFDVAFAATGTYNTGNNFTVQLSDASGSFASPVAIGTVASTTSGIINCTIPAATTLGTNYRIRIVSDNPVVISADNGADISINASLTPSVTISAAPGTSTGPNANITFTATPVNGGATPVYLWKKNGTIIAGATNSVYTAVSGVDYTTGDNITALLVSSEDCATPDTVTSNTLTMTVNLGVHDNFGNIGISIYPNPNNGHFTINGYLLQATKMELVNTMGQVVYTQQLQLLNGKVSATVNAATLPGGLYLLRIGNTTSRISIQKQ